MTFSIVAYDPAEMAWGVGVASKFLAAGAVVNWARAGAGAVATQSYARVSFGPMGLDMMENGYSARETLERLLADDPEAAQRQVGLVDAHGSVAAHTGEKCFGWAGHRLGTLYSCQGNILAGPQVVEAMGTAFEAARGELADRLVAALLAGDRAGGDRRGRQAAAVLVVKPEGGYGGDNDRYIDLRVDDHEDPVVKLGELVAMHHLYFGKDTPAQRIPVTAEIATELQGILTRLGYDTGSATGQWTVSVKEAFWAFCSTENLEERWSLTDHPDLISPAVLDFVRRRFGI